MRQSPGTCQQFCSDAKAKKKSPESLPKSTTSSMKEHITSVAKKGEENKKATTAHLQKGTL